MGACVCVGVSGVSIYDGPLSHPSISSSRPSSSRSSAKIIKKDN